MMMNNNTMIQELNDHELDMVNGGGEIFNGIMNDFKCMCMLTGLLVYDIATITMR